MSLGGVVKSAGCALQKERKSWDAAEGLDDGDDFVVGCAWWLWEPKSLNSPVMCATVVGCASPPLDRWKVGATTVTSM